MKTTANNMFKNNILPHNEKVFLFTKRYHIVILFTLEK